MMQDLLQGVPILLLEANLATNLAIWTFGEDGPLWDIMGEYSKET